MQQRSTKRYYPKEIKPFSLENVTEDLSQWSKMPGLGYGVYQTPPEETERCVLDVICIGYRSIDTAQTYGMPLKVADTFTCLYPNSFLISKGIRSAFGKIWYVAVLRRRVHQAG